MVDLTTTETGRRFLNILAKGGLSRLKEHDLGPTPEGFNKLIQIAKKSGQNAGYLLEGVEDELSELNNTAPMDELSMVQEAFIQGACQRGKVWQAMQEFTLLNNK